MLTVGIKGEQSQLVTNENTAKTMGSGTLDVFATHRPHPRRHDRDLRERADRRGRPQAGV